MENMPYRQVLPINAYQSTAWLVEFENKIQMVQIWHKGAKIQHVVDALKTQHPGEKFTVAAIDAGSFTIKHTQMSMTNARKLNQDMFVVLF